jgi:hypothetical protein
VEKDACNRGGPDAQGLGLAKLTKSFKEDDPDRGREIEASDCRVRHWDGEAGFGVVFQDALWQAAGLRAEDKAVAFVEFPVGVRPFCFGRQVNEPGFRKGFMQIDESYVTMEFDVVPVIEPGAFQRPVVHSEARHAYDVQRSTRGGAKPCDIAGIWRYFGLVKGDVRHSVPFCEQRLL